MPRPKPNMRDLLDKYVLSLGYTILEMPDEKTFNTNTLFRVICKHDASHVFTVNITDLRRGKKDISKNCPHCQKEDRYNKQRMKLDDVQNWFYENNLSVINPQKYYSRWGNDNIEFRCNKCGNVDEFKSIFHFENEITKKTHTCKSCKDIKRREHEDREKTLSAARKKDHDRIELKQSSKVQLKNYIESIYSGPIISNDREQIGPKELDIYLPDLQLAIEYCGNIWHSQKYREDPKEHYNKWEECLKKGIRLITIFEDEWLLKPEICKSRIRNLLGKNTNRIFARKCEVYRIETKVALAFTDTYHIQGKGQCKEAYGLYYNGRLISVMTFSKPSAAKGKSSDYDWEMNRFCSVFDTTIVGGASKLFSAFRRDHPGTTLVSFCDLRWGDGTVYEKLGMTMEYITKPNYYYVGEYTDWKRKHRFNFTKAKLLDIFNETNTNLTEREIAENNGLFRVYDCGHKRFKVEL